MVNTAKLRGLMAERGISQRDVAKHLKISENTMCKRMENGKFGIDEANALIELLKIEKPSDIFFAR